MTDAEVQAALSNLEVNPDPEIRIHSVASPDDVVVVDGVYRDWTVVGDLARRQEFTRDRGDYPGPRAVLRACIPQLDALIARLLSPGLLAWPMQHVVFSQLGRLADFRPEQHVPHRDAEEQLGGVIFLTEAVDFGGGTGFFRHRPTGLYGVFLGEPEMAAAAHRTGYPDVNSMLVEIPKPTPGASIYGVNPSDTWEQLHLETLKANRLVLFDARLFHAAVFDPQRDHGRRITQNLFLRVEPPSARIRFRARSR